MHKPLLRLFITLFLILIIFLTFVSITKLTISLKYQRTATVVNDGKENQRHVVLVVGILSKLTAFSRRESIRLTWMRKCEIEKSLVECYFFSDDYTNSTQHIKERILKEETENKDIIFMPYKGTFFIILVERRYWKR